MLSRHVQRAGLFLGALLAGTLFFAGGAALRLLIGPISLGAFSGVIEDALNHSVSGVVIRFDQAVLEWSRADGKVNLIVLGTKIFDLNGRIIAQAPKADLDFDAADMVAGHLNLKHFGLIGVQLTGVRSEEGVIRLGFGRDRDEPDFLETIRKILQNSAAGGSSLESFSIRNARLAFLDRPTGLFLISPDTNFSLENKGQRFEASLNSSVELSGAPAKVEARAVLRADGTPESGTLSIKGLSLPSLAQNSARFGVLKPYRLVSDVTASISFAENGAITASEFHATGTGNVDTPIFKTPLRLDRFEVKGHYDAANNRLAMEDVDVAGEPLAFKGRVDLVFGWKGGGLETVSGNVDAGKVRIDLPDWFQQPIALTQFSVQALYDQTDHALKWQRAIIKTDTLSAELNGTADFASSGPPALALTGTIAPLPASEVLRYWPTGLSEGTHQWIATNILAGNLGPVEINADLPAGAFDAAELPDSALRVTFPFEGVSTQYVAGMTPVTGARGYATLTGDSFQASVASASIGPIQLSNGVFSIPDLRTVGATAHIKARADGTVSDVLKLIDEEPLSYPKRFGINPATVGGNAAIDLDFQLPLLRDLAWDQVHVGVQAKTSSLDLLIDGRKLERGLVSFVVDSKSLAAQGTGSLSGVPVSFKWSEDFSAKEKSTHVDVAGQLDDQSRARLGLSEPKWLTGSIPVTLALTGERFQFNEAALKADLTSATADIPVLNLAKRPGIRANASAELLFRDAGAIYVNDLTIRGDGLNASGSLWLAGDGRLLNLSLAELRSGVNDFAMVMKPESGGFDVRFQGKSLDASHFWGSNDKKPRPATETDAELQNPLSLSAKVDRLVFSDKLSLRDVALDLSLGAAGRLNSLSMDATGIGKGKIAGRLNTTKGVRTLSFDADDAGAFIGGFLGFPSVRGGTLAARVSFPGDAPSPAETRTPAPDYQGTVTLSDIVLTDQPFFARLFSAGSLDGPLRLLQGQGISLNTVTALFAARGPMVTIREGRASGDAIGGTFAGTFDRKAERVDVSGTLVPIFGLNSMFGAVPVLGDILVSKKGEGIFGLTYAMKGNLNEPSLTVNPLSVFTPGIFRRIFEFDTPKEPATQTQPQSPPQAAIKSQTGNQSGTQE